MNNTK